MVESVTGAVACLGEVVEATEYGVPVALCCLIARYDERSSGKNELKSQKSWLLRLKKATRGCFCTPPARDEGENHLSDRGR